MNILSRATTYVPGNVGDVVYEWFDSFDNLNLGLFKLRGSSITELDYVTITL